MADHQDTSAGAARNRRRTAFVLAGGGSLGAVQVGMLKALVAHGVAADMVVGSSVGSINGAYYAGRPDRTGIAELERLWRGLRRRDIFPLTWSAIARFVWHREFLVSPDGILDLLERNLPFADLEQARLPIHIVATDFLSGAAVVISSGRADRAILASCAIPAAFEAVKIDGRYLVDGGIASNTPIRVAIELGATRLIVLPTGHSCALPRPPSGAMASALHGLALLISSQLVTELEGLAATVEYHVVPSLCPVGCTSYDFSQTGSLIDRAERQTLDWLGAGGLQLREIPAALRPHDHEREFDI